MQEGKRGGLGWGSACKKGGCLSMGAPHLPRGLGWGHARKVCNYARIVLARRWA